MSAWVNASKVSECYLLASMIAFTVYYVATANWWKSWLGVSIVWERVAFICVLGFLVAASFVPFGLGIEADLLHVEVILLFAAGIGLNIGLIALWVVRHKKKSVRIVPRDRS